MIPPGWPALSAGGPAQTFGRSGSHRTIGSFCAVRSSAWVIFFLPLREKVPLLSPCSILCTPPPRIPLLLDAQASVRVPLQVMGRRSEKHISPSCGVPRVVPIFDWLESPWLAASNLQPPMVVVAGVSCAHVSVVGPARSSSRPCLQQGPACFPGSPRDPWLVAYCVAGSSFAHLWLQHRCPSVVCVAAERSF